MTATDISGVRIPDSPMARDAAQLIRDTESKLLFDHSTRVYLWAALTAQRKNWVVDPELLYIGAMFHDFGLTKAYRSSQLRFEVDGANAARNFMRSRGIRENDVKTVWLAVALHTTPGIPEHLHPNIALIQAGAAMDVVGRGYDQFTEGQREAVIAAYPRGPHFKHGMIDAFYQGLKHRPDSTYGTFNDDFLACKDPGFQRADLCSAILASPWERASIA